MGIRVISAAEKREGKCGNGRKVPIDFVQFATLHVRVGHLRKREKT